MSSIMIEDDSISGSTTFKKRVIHDELIQKPPLNMRDRMIDYVIKHPKTTRGDLYIHVSSSGASSNMITSFIKSGIFIENKFDCNHCTYLEVDKSKVFLI